jgi:hypothetical protein
VGCVDPGHKKYTNKGCYGNYWEGIGNWHVANFMMNFMNSTGLFDIKLTKSKITDDPSLTERGRMAKGAKFFHSIHSNAGTSGGCEVYESVDLNDWENAKIFCNKLSKYLKVKNRGVKNRASGYGFSSVPLSSNYEDYYTVMDAAQDIGVTHVILTEAVDHSIKAECIKRLSTNYQIIEAMCHGWSWIEVFNIAFRYDRSLVKKIQTKLGVNVDGYMGVQTSSAIMQYEYQNNMVLSGMPHENLVNIGNEYTATDLINEVSTSPATWIKFIEFTKNVAKNPTDIGLLEYMKYFEELIIKCYKLGITDQQAKIAVKSEHTEIIKRCTASPDMWEAFFANIVDVANLGGDFGILETAKWLPELTIKVYQFGYNSKKLIGDTQFPQTERRFLNVTCK